MALLWKTLPLLWRFGLVAAVATFLVGSVTIALLSWRHTAVLKERAICEAAKEKSRADAERFDTDITERTVKELQSKLAEAEARNRLTEEGMTNARNRVSSLAAELSICRRASDSDILGLPE